MCRGASIGNKQSRTGQECRRNVSRRWLKPGLCGHTCMVTSLSRGRGCDGGANAMLARCLGSEGKSQSSTGALASTNMQRPTNHRAGRRRLWLTCACPHGTPAGGEWRRGPDVRFGVVIFVEWRRRWWWWWLYAWIWRASASRRMA